LASRRSHIIALVIPETTSILFTDPYFARLIQGVTQACNEHDYTLSLILFHATEDEARLPTRILHNQVLDGLIVTATHTGDLLVPHLIKNQVPFVMVGEYDDPHVSFVDADNDRGAYAAVEHLIRLGYQRIATISGPPNNRAAVQRKQGYLHALRAHGLPANPLLIATGNFSEVSGYDAMRGLLPFGPDAAFVASDTMALGARRALREAGKVVPDDVALVGYDDLPPALLGDPPLTTVRQPIKRAGIHAVELLIDILENGPAPARRVVLPTELIVRASCGALGRARAA
jgi:LacI family transcriptional regulator